MVLTNNRLCHLHKSNYQWAVKRGSFKDWWYSLFLFSTGHHSECSSNQLQQETKTQRNWKDIARHQSFHKLWEAEVCPFPFFLKKALLLNRIENIVAKGEIAHHEQFLLLPQHFQNLSAANALTLSLIWLLSDASAADSFLKT